MSFAAFFAAHLAANLAARLAANFAAHLAAHLAALFAANRAARLLLNSSYRLLSSKCCYLIDCLHLKDFLNFIDCPIISQIH